MPVPPEIDAAYLRAALERAGVAASFDAIQTTTYSDGRSGAVVTGVRAGRDRFVVKAIDDEQGFRAVLSSLPGGEVALFRSGATRDLPAPLAWPVLDASRQGGRGQWWLLMHDVADGILPRGAFDPDKLHALLRGMSRLHARYWGNERALDALPLLRPDAIARLFAEPASLVARNEPPAEPTFLHGDLRRANISYLNTSVCLLDWERAMRGHAAIDLQWYWFLQFWAYPPSEPCDPDAFRRAYLAYLEEALGRAVDREAFGRAWGLAWLKVIAEIGFLIADPLTEASPSAQEIARVSATAKRAIALARKAMDHV
jgi:hypothetical protein